MVSHLHVHTEYSMLDGLARLDPLIKRASELGMKSLAITDHGGLYGAIDFYRAAKDSGVKPIIGCEMYVTTKSRYDKDPSDPIHHLTVLAKNIEGYKNLVKLVTTSHLEGYYKKPRVDHELLEKYSGGLAVLSGCPSGEVPSLITDGRIDEAINRANWYREVFGSYFLEVMEHGNVPELPAINKGLLHINKELNIPLVATNDSHYVLEEHALDHEILLCIQTNTNMEDPKRMQFGESSYHLRSHDQMIAAFSEIPEAVTNTDMVAEMCNLQLDFTQARLPEFPVPDSLSSDEYLRNICIDGFHRLLPDAPEEYKQRLDYELEVIKQTRFPDYFLVVWDIAKFVRKNDIFFTVRGSAAASLVLYCLGVTDVDPMPFNLVFERFLNLERKEMPDIDMDFQDDRRQEVINYCSSRYGREHVAHIITFGTFGARQSVRDAGRALGMTLDSVDRVARMIPEKLNIDIDTSLVESEELKVLYESHNETKHLIETAKQLEGVTRHKSVHAAGVVISKEPLDTVVPLEFTSRGDETGAVMTQYAMDPVAALGLLKMDFLGLTNLSVLANALVMIEENHGISIRLQEIPLEDQNTFGLLSRGETIGVFQLESAGMVRYIKELKPNSINDVAAMIALYRPGPMDHITTFIDAKHGRREVRYIHPALKDILEETYGVIVYQDQVLHIAREFAGYTLGEADIVRKAMGKKVPEIMAEERDKFVEGAQAQGYTEELADSVFMLVEPFAGYAFNKAHSVSYGLVSYWTAYLKANFPAEYMAAFMNSYIGKKDRLISAIADCRRMGIPVFPPSVNSSFQKFTIEKTREGVAGIRFGLAAIKNVGSEALGPLIEARSEHGKFETLENFCKDGDIGSLNRKSIECLIMAGCLDDFGDRGGLLEVAEKINALAQQEKTLRDSSQSTMFDMLGEVDGVSLAAIDVPLSSTSDHEKRMWEVELMGMSLSSSGHLANVMSKMNNDVQIMLSQIESNGRRGRSTIGGQVSTVVDRFTRDNKPFKVITLEMLDGSLEAVVWEDALKKNPDIWDPGKIVTVTGTIRERDGDITISVQEGSEVDLDQVLNSETIRTSEEEKQMQKPYETPVKGMTNGSISNGKENNSGNGSSAHPNGLGKENGISETTNRKKLVLFIKETEHPQHDKMLLDDVKRLLLGSAGSDDVGLEIESRGSLVVMDWKPVKVDASEELQENLRNTLGDYGDVSVQSLMF